MKKEISQSDQLEKIATGRGKETLFRVASRNQIELIAIADNKANMIIGINTILISLIIAFLGSNLKGPPFLEKTEFYIPFNALIFFCLLSAVFALLAAKPNIIRTRRENVYSRLFFQNLYKKTLPQYISEMHQILSSKVDTYNQMIIDMYNNGLVLRRKYNLLGISYLLFLIGIIVTIVLLIIFSII
jgi:hypothetical protein